MWKRIERLCEWERPRATAVRLIDDVRAAPAVISFLGDIRVGKIISLASRREVEDEDSESEGEEGGPGPP